MANILPTEKKVLAVSMLPEGSSIRAIERITGVHRDTKLVPTRFVGQRTMQHAEIFLRDLRSRLAGRVQLFSDALAAYRETVGQVFGENVDYGQIVKTYSVTHLGNFKEAATRYSPAEIVSVEKSAVCEPVIDDISTSHVEKQNHTLRMHCGRLTRLTNALSKKLDNFSAAVALNFGYYNLCKRHIAVKTTPAKAAGVEDHEWTVAELVERCGE